MTESKNSKKLSDEQSKAIANNDYIRQFLLKANLIDQQGNIIPRKEKPQTLTPYIPLKKRSYPMKKITNSNGHNRSKPSDNNSNDRRIKSASTVQSKQTNKSRLSTRFSSSSQSTGIQNVLLRHAVSPKILPVDNRCLVTMIYFGPKLQVEYDREWFEPDGIEIMVMQQHCGGENLVVFKGLVQPNSTFSFRSRRHTDYPFALAFYVNGVIHNRLSVCCESRCKDCMRIGGKSGIYAVAAVENATPCRRCRFEQRMKLLSEAEPKSSTDDNQDHSQNTSKPKPPEFHTKTSKSTSPRPKSTKESTPHTNGLKKRSPRSSSPVTNTPQKTSSKLIKSRSSSSDSRGSDTPIKKSAIFHTKSKKTDEFRSLSPETNPIKPRSLSSDSEDDNTPIKKPAVFHTKSNKKDEFRSSSPETNPIKPRSLSSDSEDDNTPIKKPAVFHTKSNKTDEVRISSPESNIPQKTSSKPMKPRSSSSDSAGSDVPIKKTAVFHTKSNKKDEVRTSSPESNIPQKTSSKPMKPRSSSSDSAGSDVPIKKTAVFHTKSNKKDEVRTSSPETNTPQKTSSKFIKPRSSSSDSEDSDTPIKKTAVFHTKSNKTDEVRISSPEDRTESPPPVKTRLTTVSNHQSKPTSSPLSYDLDFKPPKQDNYSSASIPHKLNQTDASPSSNKSEIQHNQVNDQRRPSIASTDKDSDDGIRTSDDD